MEELPAPGKSPPLPSVFQGECTALHRPWRRDDSHCRGLQSDSKLVASTSGVGTIRILLIERSGVAFHVPQGLFAYLSQTR